MATLTEWLDGKTRDGRELPAEKVAAYRAIRNWNATAPTTDHNSPNWPSSKNTGRMKGVAGKAAVAGLKRRHQAKAGRHVRQPFETQQRPLYGTALKTILTSIGLKIPGCDTCNGWRVKMDRGGAVWCRQHRSEIIQRINEAKQSVDWLTYAQAGAKAFKNGVAWEIDWMDPAPGLFELAMRRAEEFTATS